MSFALIILLVFLNFRLYTAHLIFPHLICCIFFDILTNIFQSLHFYLVSLDSRHTLMAPFSIPSHRFVVEGEDGFSGL